MPLPAFTAEGLLPQGIHPATEEDVALLLVDPFIASRTRATLYNGLCRYRRDLTALDVIGIQWIDGSFVDQSRDDPADIDLVNFCEQHILNGVPVHNQERVFDLLGNASSTMEHYNCHSFVVVQYPAGHPMAEGYEARRRYWLAWFSTPQRYTELSKVPAPERGVKGIISMTLQCTKDLS